MFTGESPCLDAARYVCLSSHCSEITLLFSSSRGPRGGHRGAQRQQIAVHAKAADLPLHNLREHRVVSKSLTRMDIRHVQLDHRDREDRKRVADAIAVV